MILNILGIILDLSTFFVYQNDRQKLMWNLYYILDMLEVRNYAEVKDALDESHSMIYYSILKPPEFISFVASKFFVPLFFMFIFGLLSIKSMWEVIAENKRVQVFLRRPWIRMKAYNLLFKMYFIGS